MEDTPRHAARSFWHPYYKLAKPSQTMNDAVTLTAHYKTAALGLYFFLTHVQGKISEDLVADTSIGSIRGVRADDGDYTMFLGIPFAKVNESNVFGESLPAAPFNEVFEANTDTTRCPQVEEFNNTAVGDLDCLQLNVYVSDAAKTAKGPLPVLVYIYGGKFMFGFSDRWLLGPKHLMKQDVIVVTFNYRMGAYGFMCLDTPDVPGNAGLKDQVLALRWVKNHIASFGGDPERVTVFGNSAGGMSVGLHIISDSEKLFNNAIIQSGSPYINGIVSNTNNKDSVLALAKALNFETNDVNEALSHIASVDALKVVEVVNDNGIVFTVCVEKEFPGVDTFLSKNPVFADNSKVNGMSVLIGNNKNEFFKRFRGVDGPADWASWSKLIPQFVNDTFNFDNAELYSDLSDLIRHFYLGDAEYTGEIRKNMLAFVDDSGMIYPTMRSIATYVKAGAAKVYEYVYSYEGGRNFAKAKNGFKEPGTAHADEIGYLWEIGFLPEPTKNDQVIIDRMTRMWANFAAYNNPTPETSELLPVPWTPIVDGSVYPFINIDLEMGSGSREYHARMAFWELIYKAYAQNEKAREMPNRP
ncbi:carboxylesterase family domain-containing protein [Phthorimaea operculella]|nr:carboxylesterase family domain-containing protein [Phthorimaea operculella]